MEQGGHRVAPPAKATTFIEQWKIEDMPAGCVGSKVGVAVGLKKKNNEEEHNQRWSLDGLKPVATPHASSGLPSPKRLPPTRSPRFSGRR